MRVFTDDAIATCIQPLNRFGCHVAVDTAFLSSLVSEELPEASHIPNPVYLEVTGNVAELAVTILGRPPKDLGDHDGSTMSIGSCMVYSA